MAEGRSEVVVGVVAWETFLETESGCSDPYTCSSDCSLDSYCPKEGDDGGC